MRLPGLLVKWQLGLLARNTLLSSFWLFVRTFLLAAYLILLARAVGPESYGLLATAIAFAGLFTPLAGAGTEMLILKHASRDPLQLSLYWGKFLTVWIAITPLLTLAALVFGGIFMPGRMALAMLLPITLAEVVCMPLLAAILLGLQALERLGLATALEALLGLIRLLMALLLYLATAASATLFAWLYFMASLCTLVIAGMLALRLSAERPRCQHAGIADLIEALPFLGLALSSAARIRVDRPILLMVAGPAASGFYNAAARVAESAAMPLMALVRSAAPRLFRSGIGPAADGGSHLRFLLQTTGVVGTAASIGLFLAAPLLPWLLGIEYAPTARILRWLSPLPLLHGLHHLLLTHLMAADHPERRLFIEISGSASAIVLYFVLVPRLDILGAVLGQLLSYLVTIGLASTMVLGAVQHRRQNAPHPGKTP